MTISLGALNWLPIGASFIAGQIFLTLYFTVIFGDRWAKAYGPTKTRQEHTQEVPKAAYAMGAACTLALTLAVALLQAAVGASDLGDAMGLGLLLSAGLVAGSMTPGYAFLRRWDAYWLAVGSQVALTLLVSAILGAWPR